MNTLVHLFIIVRLGEFNFFKNIVSMKILERQFDFVPKYRMVDIFIIDEELRYYYSILMHDSAYPLLFFS